MLEISIKDLYKSFNKTKVLKGINLEIKNPGIYSILGPNGSGKTTLIKALLGLVIPSKGNIIIDGQNIRNRYNYRNQIGYMPQIARFPENLRLKELFTMIKDLQSVNGSIEPLIELFQLEPHYNKKLSNLSGGTKQKVNVVIAFMNNKPVIILDEPITGLDPIAMLQVKNLIKKEKKAGKTIIVTTHIMDLVEDISDYIVFLLDGKIYFNGSVREIKEKYKEDKIEKAIVKIFNLNQQYTDEKNI